MRSEHFYICLLIPEKSRNRTGGIRMQTNTGSSTALRSCKISQFTSLLPLKITVFWPPRRYISRNSAYDYRAAHHQHSPYEPACAGNRVQIAVTDCRNSSYGPPKRIFCRNDIRIRSCLDRKYGYTGHHQHRNHRTGNQKKYPFLRIRTQTLQDVPYRVINPVNPQKA